MATGNWVYNKDNFGLFVTVTLTESSKTVHECVTVYSNTKVHKTKCIVQLVLTIISQSEHWIMFIVEEPLPQSSSNLVHETLLTRTKHLDSPT